MWYSHLKQLIHFVLEFSANEIYFVRFGFLSSIFWFLFIQIPDFYSQNLNCPRYFALWKIPDFPDFLPKISRFLQKFRRDKYEPYRTRAHTHTQTFGTHLMGTQWVCVQFKIYAIWLGMMVWCGRRKIRCMLFESERHTHTKINWSWRKESNNKSSPSVEMSILMYVSLTWLSHLFCLF